MRKTIAIALLAIGCMILILCATFTVIQLTASETAWFEEEFDRLSLAESMGMTLGDLGASIRTLVNYMNGQSETIDLLITYGGQQIRMFDLDIEITHMREVRDLWQWFISARNVGVLAGLMLCLLGVVVDGKDAPWNACFGYYWALGFVLVIVAFAGTWATINFDSFWTAFHRLIFPNSENWLLPAESRMIQMLPSELFHDLVLRMGGRILLILLLVALACGVVLSLRVRRQQVVDPWAAKAENAPKTPEEELAAVQGPDLLIVHKKANMSVSERRKLNEELEHKKKVLADPDEGAAAEFRDAALDTPLEGRVKIDFAPVSEKPEEKPTEEDDDYDELL